jgi:hypothetical protein
MTSTAQWPDRAEFHALMQNPSQHFVNDLFRQATFATKSGRILTWNGARTIVFRAQIEGQGPMALRFPLNEDNAASTRYQRLELHLAAHALDSFVPARWMPEGVATRAAVFPVMTMPWIDGAAINRHVFDAVRSPAAKTELENLAQSWQRCCRALVDHQVAHGDIHAGNVLVQRSGNGRTQLKHIDYDSVWVPGLTEASIEIGIPGFQHPGRTLRHWGRDMDAFPNAVMYVSLIALASDPSLWRFNDSDDTMLFGADSFVRAPQGEIWDALRSSTDSRVRSLTEQLIGWIATSPTRFQTLDAFVAACETAKSGINTWRGVQTQQSASGGSTWPAPPAAGQPPATARPAKPATPSGVPLQKWGTKPPAEVGRTPAGSKPAAKNHDSALGSLVVIVCVVLVLLAILGKL